MSNSIEIITQINRVLRKKGFNRKDIDTFYNQILILANNTTPKQKVDKPDVIIVNKKSNYLSSIEPKYLVAYLQKRLSGRGYLIEKSPTSGSNTYYLRSNVLGQRVIRISNHNLHDNQIKNSQIDIVIQPNKKVKIDAIVLEGEFSNYRMAIADKLIETLPKPKK